MTKLLPDWTKPKELVLVYPNSLKVNYRRTDRKLLLPFFEDFIELITKHNPETSIRIIGQAGEKDGHSDDLLAIQILKDKLKANIIMEGFEIQDIWIRDWAPINYLRNSTNRLIKFRFKPTYCRTSQNIDNSAGKHLAAILSNSGETINLNLEGGNIISNGEVMITTEKFYTENRTKTKEAIDILLKTVFGLKEIIVIPVEKHDKVGHIDGICRFIDEKTLIFPSYPTYYPETKYIDNVINIIHSKLKKYKIKFHCIESYLTDNINKEDIYSAEGNYMNYFRIENVIYVPQFNIFCFRIISWIRREY